MRLSEGAPRGRFVKLYHPELFQDREEVIIFKREEFNRIYTSMQEQISIINKIILHTEEEYQLLSYWPKLMERVYLLDLNMEFIFKSEPVQCVLDTYLYDSVRSSKKEVAVSKRKVSSQIQLSI